MEPVTAGMEMYKYENISWKVKTLVNSKDSLFSHNSQETKYTVT